MKYQILQGDNRQTLKTLADNSIDAIVTDPPYGIDFLGKSWDANTGALETYQECLRVLKPGGHIVAFSAARTYHHLAITLEQAGFEIRDQIMWIYSSGFPKSQDVGKSIERTNKKKNRDDDNDSWAGWGTALKPAHEPIALARKPLKQSIAQNCQQWGVGALNIDAARIPYDDGQTNSEVGRFPSNVIGEIPDYQKYFYCPKVSRKERHTGFGDLSALNLPDFSRKKDEDGNPVKNNSSWMYDPKGVDKIQDATTANTNVGNNHPTVKPIELMKYLIKLITPPGGTVLDPFNGSGSTGCAAVELGHEYIGCELDEKYVEIAKKRIEAWNKEDTAFNELFGNG
jgi:site-specific DNA-methyltransferase (adenine-specific)